MTAHCLIWNQRGLIPGPEETEEEFFKRAGAAAPLALAEEWQQANLLTKDLFDFSLNWVEISPNEQKLPFWQGAATWIQGDRVHIQLKRSALMSVYSQEEVLAHEAVHAARMAFNESKFEEFFAYRTSRKKWRRWVGPLFEASWESSLLIIFFLVSFLAQGVELFIGTRVFLTALIFLPWFAIGGGVFRLWNKHTLLNRCIERLKLLVKEERAWAVACRLTDREITLFAHSSSEEILHYVQREKENSLRWKIVAAAYFNL